MYGRSFTLYRGFAAYLSEAERKCPQNKGPFNPSERKRFTAHRRVSSCVSVTNDVLLSEPNYLSSRNMK